MKNFGKFTARQGNPKRGEDSRFTYYENVAGIEWDTFFSKPENKISWYMAVNEEGRIGCCDKDAMQVRCSGLTVVGLEDIAPWTNNEGGTIYGCRIDFENGKIIPPPLPEIAKRQIKLWLLQKGKNPKKYPAEIIAQIPDAKLKIQAEIEWEDGDTYSRESDFIKALTKALDWSDEAVNSIWQQIAAVE